MLVYYFFISLWALLVSADFDVYLVTSASNPGKPFVATVGWQIVDPSRDSCPDPAHTRMILDKTDVSGNKIGIRCITNSGTNGCGPLTTSLPTNIDIMEMHLSETPKMHYTIYKGTHGVHRSYELLGLGGESAGHCEPQPWPPSDQKFANCGEYTLWKKMRCLSFYTADWVNDYERGWHP
ncbi:hypothetical protein DPSP01_002165 [Paraphaeosphaeria sporulosa]|uniref:Secreted protein n=1 Tax=Paraphaeosphaeria sporulosa TaxID=1460663 RepID=A0A177C1U3_9PLEO|nr:uncharacterized protein CC84DRAFT_1222184 [Paraphaeosphaeria sporulosa]OAG00707.1 hypothetical protein CC84DRAFT_1222184 [Paraphaeosphaeria sporulosa]